MMPQKVCVAAAFAADPLAEILTFWMRRAGRETEIAFAPAYQIFQQLLDPNSELSQNRSGINLLAVRCEDWHFREDNARVAPEELASVEDAARDFAAGLKSAAAQNPAPFFVCFCPAAASPPETVLRFEALELQIAAELADSRNVHCVRSAELTALYRFPADYAPDGLPAHPEFFAALGTLFARKILALDRPPVKVLAADCDNTLWGGVCGEVGAAGVTLSEPYLAAQRFLIRQRDAGVLLCLNSKNGAADVWDVFDSRPDMLLKRKDILASRINWRAKSENLQSLAAELNLGLDSFVFLDDNPLECGEVRAHCPEVLTLQLPTNEAEIPDFLNHVWAFDRLTATGEDSLRTELYRQNLQRNACREQSAAFADFLAALELKITIAPLRPEQFDRVSQLTQRTNQFNFTSKRYTISEVERAIANGVSCFAVEVTDRFGDYGLVGVLMAEAQTDALTVTNFLLSCRVLGRGVEHRMVAFLGEQAQIEGRKNVVLRYAETRKNKPALAFLESLTVAQHADESGEISFLLTAEAAANTAYFPSASAPAAEISDTEKPQAPQNSVPALDYQQTADELQLPAAILSAIRAEKRQNKSQVASTAPRTALEEAIAAQWADILGVSAVGATDDFFNLGGNSLQGMTFIHRIAAPKSGLFIGALFDAPTAATFAAHLEANFPQIALQIVHSEPATSAPITPEIQNDAPLSFAQYRLWFLEQLHPGQATYNVPYAIRLRGNLDIPALQKSLNAITARHAALRTTFLTRDGQPAQRVAPVLDVPLKIEAVSEEAAANDRLEATARQPFDLQNGPLFRAHLVAMPPQSPDPNLAEDGQREYTLLLCLHHIVCDGWALNLLMQELNQHYTAFTQGRSAPLKSLTIQYPDFARWQRNAQANGDFDSALKYWKTNLANLPPALNLPTDFPRPLQASYRGAAHHFRLSAPLARSLQTLSRQENATLFMTLLAAFQTLLFRYANQADLCVGTPIANRQKAELEPLIGFFVNTLVLRGDLSGNITFRQLLQRTRTAALTAYAHQDAPFEQVVEAVQPERQLQQSPLFQVLFALQSSLSQNAQLGDLDAELFDVSTGTAKFDLFLSLTETGGELAGTIEYSADLFLPETMARFAGHFHTLLAALADNPDALLAELPLLTNAERQQILIDWNPAQSEDPPRLCAQQLFERQAQTTPNALAVIAQPQENRQAETASPSLPCLRGQGLGASLTYAELNAQANQLARFLQALGVGAETRVGICLPRSPQMLLALLAVLKAGGAYVPLDPAYPAERLAFMLEDAAAPVLLTTTLLRATLPQTAAQVVCLDGLEIEAELQEQSSENLSRLAQPDNLAYVLYTSGSTGKPKGVAIEHRSVAALLRWAESVYTANELSGVLAATSICFDLSIFEIFVPLTTGGSVILAENILHLPTLANRESVTLINTVPSAITELLRMGALPASVKVVNLAGEPLTAALANQLYAAGIPKVYDLYGPSEDTTYSTCALRQPNGPATIGRPISNTQTYILDQNLNPVPIGIPGELYLAGAGLARGYLNRPDLTAEKFVPAPSALSPQPSTLYATGDLARYLPSGDIQYLGRLDHQVKLRGYRIELPEIEAVLTSHAAAQSAVVMMREDAPGDQRLVAYIVPNPDYRPEADEAEAQNARQVSQWQAVFDEAYTQNRAGSDPKLNFSGWYSSYTRLPIPVDEMREWADATTARILAQNPKRVLELGCGTGLLLLRIAPHCVHYCGMDSSAAAIAELEKHADNLPNVRLAQGAAHELAALAGERFDCIVVNSVAQYFPGADYLLQVLETALDLLEPGGTFFFGDIRSLDLLETFHSSAHLYQANNETSAAALRQKVQRDIRQERELLISPALFQALPRRFPRISRVEIQQKRGRFANEMNTFRYDAILRVAAKTADAGGIWQDWQAEDGSVEKTRRTLAETNPDVFSLRDVPNARLRAAVAANKMLTDPDGPATVGELRERLRQTETDGVEPENFFALGDDLPYEVTISYAASGKMDCFDVRFSRCGAESSESFAPLSHDEETTGEDFSRFTNNPLRETFSANVIPELRKRAQERLPDYMIPAAFVLLEALPMTPNGKVDRNRLPAPDANRPELTTGYAPPRNETETQIAALWMGLLGVEQTGIHDNFFELGGHSLLATQLVSRLSAAFSAAIPLGVLFDYPTIAAFSDWLGAFRMASETAAAFEGDREEGLL